MFHIKFLSRGGFGPYRTPPSLGTSMEEWYLKMMTLFYQSWVRILTNDIWKIVFFKNSKNLKITKKKILKQSNLSFHLHIPLPFHNTKNYHEKGETHGWLLVNIYFQFSQFPPVAFRTSSNFSFPSVVIVISILLYLYWNKFSLFALFSDDWLVKNFN